MYQEERLYKILNMLKEQKTLSNQQIMETFDISRDTARRDIIRLVEEGVAIRTHGGITMPTLQNEVKDYLNRMAINSAEKNLLGKFAAKYLKPDQMCFFDVSTTIQALCHAVEEPVYAYTNSLDNLNVLIQKQCEIHLLGGKVNIKNRFLYGSATAEALQTLYFDIAFLGAAAVSEDGIYVTDQEDAYIKKIVANHAKFVCVIADREKFTKHSRHLALKYEAIDLIITNDQIPSELFSILKKALVRVEVVD